MEKSGLLGEFLLLLDQPSSNCSRKRKLKIRLVPGLCQHGSKMLLPLSLHPIVLEFQDCHQRFMIRSFKPKISTPTQWIEFKPLLIGHCSVQPAPYEVVMSIPSPR